MALRLKWKNPNSGASVVRIYRSVTPIDTTALPAPIVEVSDGSTQYLDEFPKYGESFYYVFAVTINGRTMFSTNKLYSCVIDLGPGPKDIMLGDMKMGYFGKVAPAELGFNATVFPDGTFTTLHKIARNGKILYAPLYPLQSSPSAWIAAKVFTSGVNPANDPYAGSAGMIREYSGRLYAMRAAKLWDDANTDTTIANYQLGYGPGTTGVTAPLGKSEFVDILRISTNSHPQIPARFSLNSDQVQAGAASPYVTSDFVAATQVAAPYFSNSSNRLTALMLAGKPLTNTNRMHPVIEYKGNA